jgi:hypothetical protein
MQFVTGITVGSARKTIADLLRELHLTFRPDDLSFGFKPEILLLQACTLETFRFQKHLLPKKTTVWRMIGHS